MAKSRLLTALALTGLMFASACSRNDPSMFAIFDDDNSAPQRSQSIGLAEIYNGSFFNTTYLSDQPYKLEKKSQ